MLVVADDLTGACDVAAVFAEGGWPAFVPLGRGALPGSLLVYNTQSREVSRARAVRRIGQLLCEVTPALVFKKIDTALRGHVGAELEAILERVAGGVAIVAPAIPEVGRYTREGKQWSGSLTIDESFAEDGASRVVGSSILDLLSRQTEFGAQAFGLEVVRGGGLAAEMAHAVSCGRRILVLDSESADDLRMIVEASGELPCPLVLVGSTGLARAWLAERRRRAAGEAPRWPKTGSALLVVGSANPVARAQCEFASRRAAAKLFLLDAGSEKGYEGAIEGAIRELSAGRNAIFALARPRGRVAFPARRKARRLLAHASLEAARRSKPARLVLVGGETAYAVLKLALAKALYVSGAWAPLVARGVVVGGAFDGVALLTKGGSTGRESLLWEAICSHEDRELSGEADETGGGAVKPCAYRS